MRASSLVGIAPRRRRTVIVRTTAGGEVLETVRIVSDVERLVSVMAKAGECLEVVLQATHGWCWAVEVLQAGGARVHLAHPLGVKAFGYRRVKKTGQIGLPRCWLGRLPASWIAPSATRELLNGPAPGEAGQVAGTLQGLRPSLTRRPLNVNAAVEDGPKPQVTKVMTGPASSALTSGRDPVGISWMRPGPFDLRLQQYVHTFPMYRILIVTNDFRRGRRLNSSDEISTLPPTQRIQW